MVDIHETKGAVRCPASSTFVQHKDPSIHYQLLVGLLGSKIWTEVFDELRQSYSSYSNYFDVTLGRLRNAYEQDTKLKKFVEGPGKIELFKRQRVVQIMTAPAQRFPSVKLIGTETSGELRRIYLSHSNYCGRATEKLRNAYHEDWENRSQGSNIVRINTDTNTLQLCLTNEVDNLSKGPSLHLHIQMKFADVPYECERVVTEEQKNYPPSGTCIKGHHRVSIPHLRRWPVEEDLTRHKGEAATSRPITSVDYRLGSSALRKTKTPKC
ncbi:unnamed protein product [Angiostrongylus costaricensis]|uniref:Uncharacterized protein n=1 Tax=Angiostrongylus costaricensis TaxID=334426 RepID=A0A0R3Q2D6_ANGCS|nr:unnamed protein product [Angiostrongylus costaricensis]